MMMIKTDLLPNGRPLTKGTYHLPREPEQAPKTYDSQANFRWTNSLLILHLWNENGKCLVVGCGRKLFPWIKGKQTSFTSMTSAAVQLKFLVWKWPGVNFDNSLEKTLVLKSWLFPKWWKYQVGIACIKNRWKVGMRGESKRFQVLRYANFTFASL